MLTFHIEPATVARLTTSLKDNAASIAPLPVPPVPTTGPVAAFATALLGAIAHVNDHGEQLRAEALRIADVMELTVDAARQVDGAFATELKAALS